MQVPAGRLTVLLGSQPTRRRLLRGLDDTTVLPPDGRRLRLRRVVSSPALPVDKRVALLDRFAAEDLDLVLVDRATDGLRSAERRWFLDHLPQVVTRGAAVVVDDADPVAVLARADYVLRVDGGHLPVLSDLDRWPTFPTRPGEHDCPAEQGCGAEHGRCAERSRLQAP